MTNREFYTAIAENETLSEEIRNHATELIAKLDATAEKRKGKVSKADQEKRDANEALARRVAAEILTTQAKTATDIAAEMNELMPELLEKPATPQKGTSIALLCVKMNLAVQTDVKIPKKGTQKAYTIVDMGDAE